MKKDFPALAHTCEIVLKEKKSFYKSVFAIFCQFEANLNKIDGLQSMKEEENNKTHIIVPKNKLECSDESL